MKVKVLQKCFIGSGGNNFPGDELELEDAIANKLIARGFVEAKKAAKKATPKKVNRAVVDLETPEDE